jgi:hypothetical protein
MVKHEKFVVFRIWVRIRTCLAFLNLCAMKLANIFTFLHLFGCLTFQTRFFLLTLVRLFLELIIYCKLVTI